MSPSTHDRTVNPSRLWWVALLATAACHAARPNPAPAPVVSAAPSAVTDSVLAQRTADSLRAVDTTNVAQHDVTSEALNIFGDDSDLIFHSITGKNLVSSSDYRQSLNYTVRPGDFASGRFAFFTIFDTRLAHGDLVPERVTIAQVVPEPAAWAMMIGGFGFMGMALRRRAAVSKVRLA